MKKKIFWRFFLVTFCALLLVFASGIFAVYLNTERIIEQRLTLESDIFIRFIKNEQDIDKLENYKNKEDFRITVIKEDGTVIYESSIDNVLEENHSDREEIESALKGEPKTVKRYSETFDCNMTYYAVASVFDTGGTYVLRLAVRSANIASYIGVMVPFLFVVLFVSLVFTGLISNKLSESISHKVKSVASGLRYLNEGRYTPIQADSDEPEFYAVFREINELAENTRKYLCNLEEEKNKLKIVLDNILQGIVAVDSNKKIVFANPAVSSLFEKNSYHIGEPLIFLVEDMGLYEKIYECLDSGKDFEYKFGEKELSVAVRRIFAEEGVPVASIIIITDITKEKNMAKEKSEFFSNASHELKTPVTVLLGLSELMLEKSTPKDANRTQLERIHHESVRLAGLISDMLELSGLERNGRSEIIRSDVDLRSVCEEVLTELSPKLSEKKLTYTIKGNGTVKADPGQMYELVDNICSNAVNYNKDGGSVKINLSENENFVILEITDTGIGIAKEHLPRICERFYRVDKSRSKKTGGTGLGLAIVKHICMLHSAVLNIDSELEIGTKVSIKFPKKDEI